MSTLPLRAGARNTASPRSVAPKLGASARLTHAEPPASGYRTSPAAADSSDAATAARARARHTSPRDPLPAYQASMPRGVRDLGRRARQGRGRCTTRHPSEGGAGRRSGDAHRRSEGRPPAGFSPRRMRSRGDVWGGRRGGRGDGVGVKRIRRRDARREWQRGGHAARDRSTRAVREHACRGKACRRKKDRAGALAQDPPRYPVARAPAPLLSCRRVASRSYFMHRYTRRQLEHFFRAARKKLRCEGRGAELSACDVNGAPPRVHGRRQRAGGATTSPRMRTCDGELRTDLTVSRRRATRGDRSASRSHGCRPCPSAARTGRSRASRGPARPRAG